MIKGTLQLINQYIAYLYIVLAIALVLLVLILLTKLKTLAKHKDNLDYQVDYTKALVNVSKTKFDIVKEDLSVKYHDLIKIISIVGIIKYFKHRKNNEVEKEYRSYSKYRKHLSKLMK